MHVALGEAFYVNSQLHKIFSHKDFVTIIKLNISVQVSSHYLL